MSNKPSIPKGTRDFGSAEMSKRNFIFNTIKKVFIKFGFSQLETPTMENLSILMGKYGDEGDQLLFKILNSGNYLSKVVTLDGNSSKSLLPKISEKGLRYDLTVPFARYVAMNRGTLTFPFKRFQIQPVWRADRPQKGRYREFYQCDADVVGTNSLLCEADIVLMINEVFKILGISNFTIKINNRKILSGLAEVAGVSENESDLFIAIDKLDKIGKEKVIEELKEKGFSNQSIELLSPIFDFQKGMTALLRSKEILSSSEKGIKGVDELIEVFGLITKYGCSKSNLEFDFTLARGLSYYTGAIFEVKVNDVSIGSVSGGGRYDNLTGVFGLEGISGVGISFGVDRIYDVMSELNLFPSHAEEQTKVLFTNFDSASRDYVLPKIAKFRAAGISSELFPDSSRLKKQMSYANKKSIPYVAMAGPNEISEDKITLKKMSSGDQTLTTVDNAIKNILES